MTLPLANAEGTPLVRILEESGTSVDGLPVLRAHPEPEPFVRELERGFSGRFLRTYQAIQEWRYRGGGPRPEPAYLLLSGNRGGFPRFGFVLEGKAKPEAGFVDLHHSIPASGRFGALDQIFPHELAHVLVHQLVGPPTAEPVVQIHGVGVRTNRATAFDEGFAEHLQVLAADDVDAARDTAEEAADEALWGWTRTTLEGYCRELRAIWAPFSPRRLTFPLWYNRVEQVLRHHAVKQNLFALQPGVGESPQRGFYSAHLAETLCLPQPEATPRPIGQMMAVEGVISSFFHRWVTEPALGGSFRPQTFYEGFGRRMEDVSAQENAYLKIGVALHAAGKRDVAALVETYQEMFPEERDRLREVVAETFGEAELPSAEPIWLAVPGHEIGTSLFDQFRVVPRPYAFDLNAASITDLMTIPGMTASQAEAWMDSLPVLDLDDLAGRVGISSEQMARLQSMRVLMVERVEKAIEAEEAVADGLGTILRSYLWRALLGMGLAWILGTVAHQLGRACTWRRASINSFGAAFVGCWSSWILGGAPLVTAVVAPGLLFALPGSLWTWRRKGAAEARRVALSWILASLPAGLLITPWG